MRPFINLIVNLIFCRKAVDAALKHDQPNRALILSLRMNEDTLIKKCIIAVPPSDIPAVASAVPFKYLQRLVEALADLLEKCPHLEFILRWCQVILTIKPQHILYVHVRFVCCLHFWMAQF